MKKYGRLGFTIAELLVALAIVGTIAAMTVPEVVKDLQSRILITQLKNTIGEIQQLANNQLVLNHTRSLENTDFADPSVLLTPKNFPIAFDCGAEDEGFNKCWTQQYRSISGNTNTRYNVRNRKMEEGLTKSHSVKLKSGSIITYEPVYPPDFPYLNTDPEDKVFGTFRIDINGDAKPNTIGRDVFWFQITKKGKIMDNKTANNQKVGMYECVNKLENGKCDYSNYKTHGDQCKTGESISTCFALLVKNNWKMPY